MCDVVYERQYLAKALTFLKHYQWLFKYKNTDIFTEEVLTNLPKEWRDYCNRLTVSELHNFVTGTVVKVRSYSNSNRKSLYNVLENFRNQFLQTLKTCSKI